MAVMHLFIKSGADIFIQSGVIGIFPKLNMADFQLFICWPLWSVDSRAGKNIGFWNFFYRFLGFLGFF